MLEKSLMELDLFQLVRMFNIVENGCLTKTAAIGFWIVSFVLSFLLDLQIACKPGERSSVRASLLLKAGTLI